MKVCSVIVDLPRAVNCIIRFRLLCKKMCIPEVCGASILCWNSLSESVCLCGQDGTNHNRYT